MTSLDLRLIRPTTWLGGKTLLMVLLVSSLLIALFSAATYLDVELFQILAVILLIGAALVTMTRFPLVLVGAPHNIFLETAFEQGLVGLLSLLALIGAVFRRLFRFLGSEDGRFAFLFPVVLFSLAVTCFSGDITAKALWFWFGTVFAAARITQNSIAYTDRSRRRAYASEFSYYPLPGR